jgi:hypothetical protein
MEINNTNVPICTDGYMPPEIYDIYYNNTYCDNINYEKILVF